MIFRSLRVGAYPLLLAGMAFVASSCTGAVPYISKDKVEEVRLTQHVDLDHGRTIYIANCSGCHQLHPTAEYTANEWDDIFGEMSQKAHLSSSDSLSVLSYLHLAAKPVAAH